MVTSIEDEMVPKLRRAIGDTEEPYTYADTALAEYIGDSVENMRLRWEHNYKIDWEELEIEPEVNTLEQRLFILGAQIDIALSQPNINFSVGPISVRRIAALDNREALKEKLDKAINRMRTMESLGNSTDEFDEKEKRFEQWLDKLLYY